MLEESGNMIYVGMGGLGCVIQVGIGMWRRLCSEELCSFGVAGTNCVCCCNSCCRCLCGNTSGGRGWIGLRDVGFHGRVVGGRRGRVDV